MNIHSLTFQIIPYSFHNDSLYCQIHDGIFMQLTILLCPLAQQLAGFLW